MPRVARVGQDFSPARPHGRRTTLSREAIIEDRTARLTDRDPLAGSSWSNARTVEGFVRSPPNATLVDIAATRVRASRRASAQPEPASRLLDIGCGAGRNAVPLALAGWRVTGTDLSAPMLIAAASRARAEDVADRVDLVLAPMESLPFAANTFDFAVAHGIWNLARSGRRFREAVREASRVVRAGALLFVFTFSRHTLPDEVSPLPGESFVFTQFSGEPQCFLTDGQLVEELAAVGFEPEPSFPLRELNRPPEGLRASGGPVIYEGVFRHRDR